MISQKELKWRNTETTSDISIGIKGCYNINQFSTDNKPYLFGVYLQLQHTPKLEGEYKTKQQSENINPSKKIIITVIDRQARSVKTSRCSSCHQCSIPTGSGKGSSKLNISEQNILKTKHLSTKILECEKRRGDILIKFGEFVT